MGLNRNDDPTNPNPSWIKQLLTQTKTTRKMTLTFNQEIYSELLSKHQPRIIKSEEESIFFKFLNAEMGQY